MLLLLLCCVQGVGELVGGSQREERVDVLERRMKDANMNLHEYEWYINLRKYGSVVHSGFGMGFERYIRFLTGIQHVKDTILVPRTPGITKY